MSSYFQAEYDNTTIVRGAATARIRCLNQLGVCPLIGQRGFMLSHSTPVHMSMGGHQRCVDAMFPLFKVNTAGLEAAPKTV
jgi:hypothetical protein